MPAEKALALVLRTIDWSESSRVATLWTREFGKVRALAKGGRRLRSSFENALDLLTLCSIVLLRKSSGGLDLLTEARVEQRFAGLATNLPALYAGYYLAELLDAFTEEHDPHPALFEYAVETLRELSSGASGIRVGLRVLRFEMQLLDELGYSPVLERCAGCGGEVSGGTFSVAAGGVVCSRCRPLHRDRLALSAAGLDCLRKLAGEDESWQTADRRVDAELRRVLGQYITYRLGRRPRLLAYLEKGEQRP